jgi:hypothetical protein
MMNRGRPGAVACLLGLAVGVVAPGAATAAPTGNPGARGAAPNPAVQHFNVDQIWRTGNRGSGVTVALPFPMTDAHPERELARRVPDGAVASRVKFATPFADTAPRCGVTPTPPDACEAGWSELILDISTILSFAPDAQVLVVQAQPRTAADEIGVHSLDEVLRAVDWIAAGRHADVVSMSFDIAEAEPGATQHLRQIDGPLARAYQAGIPVVAASGDCGSTDDVGAGDAQCGHVSRSPTVAWPASSPYVIAVGGLAPLGRLGYDPLWFSSGAGRSVLYNAPTWQARLAGHATSRSVPDITMGAQRATSESAAQFAAVLALVVHAWHARFGPLPPGAVLPALYALGAHGAADGIVDVRSGNNTFQVCASPGSCLTVPGVAAGAGFDTASGWGTIDAARFVPALVAAIGAPSADRTASPQTRSSTTVARPDPTGPTSTAHRGNDEDPWAGVAALAVVLGSITGWAWRRHRRRP